MLRQPRCRLLPDQPDPIGIGRDTRYSGAGGFAMSARIGGDRRQRTLDRRL